MPEIEPSLVEIISDHPTADMPPQAASEEDAGQAAVLRYQVQQMQEQLKTLQQQLQTQQQHHQQLTTEIHEKVQSSLDTQAYMYGGYVSTMNMVFVAAGLVLTVLSIGGYHWIRRNIKLRVQKQTNNAVAEQNKKFEGLHTKFEDQIKTLDEKTKEMLTAHNSKFTELHNELANKLKALDENTQKQKEDTDKQLEAMRLFEQGNAAYKENKPDQAIDYYTKSLEKYEYSETYCNRGFAHARLENYKTALEDHTKAIELNPQYATAYYNRGVTHKILKNYEAAMEDFVHTLKINPEDAGAYYKKACVYALMGKPLIEILDALKKAIDLDASIREQAQTDEDFASIRHEPAFRALVGLPSE